MNEYEQRNLPKQESETLEYKENTSEREKAGEDIVAMANKSGGQLYFGVKDNGELVNKLSANGDIQIREISNFLFDNIKPSLPIEVLSINCDNWMGIKINIPKTNIEYYTWKQKPFIRIGSASKQMDLSEYHRRLNLINKGPDWSAQICEGATIDDLDEEAIERAKIGYIAKYAKTAEDKQRIQNYTTEIFLEEAKITLGNQITYTAILLLGKEKSQPFLHPMGGAEIFWREMTSFDDISFKIPFVKTIPQVVAKITTRNIELSLKVLGQPMMHKIKDNYSQETLRECVANCVAHQDYLQRSRIVIYEYRNNKIKFENAGASLYDKEEFNQIRLKKKIPTKYRNAFLRNAMEQIGLIEAKGTGHHKIYQYNTKEVYLPLPEIDWSNQKEFILTLYGASLDEKFAEILQQKTDLEPEVILLLDQVQKGFRIDQKIFYNLKKQGLVEGVPTKGKLSFEFMKQIGKENEYIDQKMDDENLKWNICKKIEHSRDGCSRQEIYNYLNNQSKFPIYLNQNQRSNKLTNILTKLKNDGFINKVGGKTYAKWIMIRKMKIE